jgi:hypothetical protein
MTKSFIILIFVIVIIINISDSFADNINENIESIFYSKNGTGLTILKMQEEVNIVFTHAFRNNERFDGYVYYNIIEGNKRITDSKNFTASEMPKTFTFSYIPQKAGIFPITKGIISNSGDFNREESQSIIVLEKFSKAMKFNGQCKKPFPEFTLVIKPDFSTAACVKMETVAILKERGWL